MCGPTRLTFRFPDRSVRPANQYNTWNAEGSLVSSLTEHDSWGRLGKLDVPQRVVQTSAGKDKVVVRTIEFKNLEIPKAQTASK